MAIKYYSNDSHFKTTHIGCVIDRETRDYRAMSDVYTTADYALVWLPEEEDTKWIRVNINYMGCDSHGVIERDITKGQYAEDYEIYLMIQEDIKRENERIEAERQPKAQPVEPLRVARFRREPKASSSTSAKTALALRIAMALHGGSMAIKSRSCIKRGTSNHKIAGRTSISELQQHGLKHSNTQTASAAAFDTKRTFSDLDNVGGHVILYTSNQSTGFFS